MLSNLTFGCVVWLLNDSNQPLKSALLSNSVIEYSRDRYVQDVFDMLGFPFDLPTQCRATCLYIMRAAHCVKEKNNGFDVFFMCGIFTTATRG